MEKTEIKEKPYYNVMEFAILAGVTRQTIHRDIKEGKTVYTEFKRIPAGELVKYR